MLGTTLLYLFLSLSSYSTSYDLVREYSGLTFFDRWEFYGSWDNLTHGTISFAFLSSSHLPLIGDVVWVDRDTAFQQDLAYIDEQNRVIIKVDNANDVPFNEKRNSVIVTAVPIKRQIQEYMIPDSDHFARLLQRWKPLDYRLDAYTLRMFGSWPSHVAPCRPRVNHRIVTAGLASVLEQRTTLAA